MKVLHIGEYVNGGVATYLRTLIDGLQQYKDIEVYLLMSEYKSQKEWGVAPKKVIYYKYKRNIFNIFSAIKQIHSLINEIKPDIIHVHSSWAGLFVRLPNFFSKKNYKVIYQPHGWAFLMDTSKVKKYIYILIEKVLSIVTDKIINISNYEQKKAIEYGINPNKMVMIYNGVKDTQKVSDLTINMNKDKINLLFVGRLDKQKGLDIFLDVYNEYSFKNIHLYVIGKSILDDTIPNNTKKTTYLGWINGKDIDSYYQACDAVIMPSRWEGFGLVAIEAMRNSKAVIGSNVGALPELIKENINGYIFDINKLDSLKDILYSLNKNNLRSLGNNARNIFIKNFIDNIFIERIYSEYKRIK